ncbi:hypothetical protein DXG01_013168 [Tephrocybe rancida]|nr:hypothetical protein DXG01_013168 [Tephrocybe rancida]
MLSDLPSDILSAIFSHLELHDLISAISVCCVFRQLTDSKPLWIFALTKASEARNLACPLGTDVTQMSVDELKRVARRTDKLYRNWSLDRPCIARAVRSVPYPDTNGVEPDSIIATIPATSLVVLYLREQEQIVICDSEGKIPLFSTRVGQVQFRAHFDEPLRHLIAVTTTEDHGTVSWLKIISIEYGNGEVPSIRELFTYLMPAQHDVYDIFLTTNIVGLVRCLEDESLCVHAVNFAKNVSVEIPMPFGNFTDPPLVICSVIDKIPYITVALRDVYEVYRCPVDKLVSEADLNLEKVEAEICTGMIRVVKITRSYTEGNSNDWDTAELRLSAFGFHMLRVLYVNDFASITYSFLWPLENLHSLGLDGVPIAEGLTHAETSIDGRPPARYMGRTAWLASTSHSGIYSAVIIMTDDNGGDWQLYLLQRVLRPPNIHVRILDVPHYINLDQIYALAIEERHGVIYLTHERGYVFSIPYS